jgi:hypothetical protein
VVDDLDQAAGGLVGVAYGWQGPPAALVSPPDSITWLVYLKDVSR